MSGTPTENPAFARAALTVQNELATRLGSDRLLRLYALYKQATVGDNHTARPGLLNVRGRAKWNAWDGLRGTSVAEAQQQYIDLVTQETCGRLY